MTDEEMEQSHKNDSLIDDGYTEVVEGEDKDSCWYRYQAVQDSYLTVWLSDITSDDLKLACSITGNDGLYVINRNDDYRNKVFVKKGQTVYIRLSDTGLSKGGSLTFHCKAEAAKSIKSARVVTPPPQVGYIEGGDYFGITRNATCGKVEFTYTDGTTEKMQIGADFGWEKDSVPGNSDELGKYTYSVYYRGYEFTFNYELKSLRDVVKTTPIKLEQDVDVTYNNGEFVGFSFVPGATGMYAFFMDLHDMEDIPFYVCQDNGRVESSGNVYQDGVKELYLVKNREYIIYVQVKNKGETFRFSIDNILNGMEKGLEVSHIEDQWYTGEEIFPIPKVTYYGKDISGKRNYRYSYYFKNNVNPGIATIEMTYGFKDEEDVNHYGDITIHFAIYKPFEQADVKIDNGVYTGKGVEPKETVSWNGTVLKKDKDYKITYENNVNAGTATAVFTGIGDYKGTLQKNYQIAKAEQSLQVQDTFITYKKSKAFSVKFNAKGKVTYKVDNQKAVSISKEGKVIPKGYGVANITLQAEETDNYKAVSKTFKVIVTCKPSKVVKVKSLKKKKLQVTVQKVKDAKGYEITLSTDQNFEKDVKKVETKSTKKTFKKWKGNKTYYVKVRSYRKVKGKKLYSQDSKVYRVK